MAAQTFKQFFHTWTQELLKWLDDKFSHIDVDTTTLAQRTDVKDGNDTAISMLKNSTSGLPAIKTAIDNIDIDTTGLAQRTDVKDGNDTTIGMLKDSTNGLAALKQAIANIDFSALAKQGSNTAATNTAILAALSQIDFSALQTALQGSDTTATLTAIKEAIGGSEDPGDLPEGLADRILLLLQFFGIEGSFEAEAKGGETTNNPVIDECKTRFAETFSDLLPSGFTMPNSVTIEGTTYTGTIS